MRKNCPARGSGDRDRRQHALHRWHTSQSCGKLPPHHHMRLLILWDAEGECLDKSFPRPGETVTLEQHQN